MCLRQSILLPLVHYLLPLSNPSESHSLFNSFSVKNNNFSHSKFSKKKKKASKIKKKRQNQKIKDEGTDKEMLEKRRKEDIEKEQKEKMEKEREEKFNNMLNDFFGKIKRLKNCEVNDLNEELDKLVSEQLENNDYGRTKKREIRMNDFISTLSDWRKFKAKDKVYGSFLYFKSPLNNELKMSEVFTVYNKNKKNKTRRRSMLLVNPGKRRLSQISENSNIYQRRKKLI